MWPWISSAKNVLSRFSVTAMLREQLALSHALSVKLESENMDLKAKVSEPNQSNKVKPNKASWDGQHQLFFL
jgi:hypothetical protein